LAALRSFCESGVEFIVVGGLAAVLNGAPVDTYDVDLVYSRVPENVGRLLKLLGESHLAGSGHLNLLTRYGPMDLLAQIGQGLGFAELLAGSNEMEIGAGVRVRVLNLETVISVKEYLGSEKDLAALPVLRRTLEESRKRSGH